MEKTLESTVITAQELLKRMKEHDKRLSKIVYIEKGKYICFKTYPEEKNSYVYDFPLSECADIRSILQWIDHLIEKTWVTKEMIDRFLYLALDYHGIDLYQNQKINIETEK